MKHIICVIVVRMNGGMIKMIKNEQDITVIDNNALVSCSNKINNILLEWFPKIYRNFNTIRY